VVEVVEHAASDRQVEQVTAGERLGIDLDAVGAMMLQDDLRKRKASVARSAGTERIWTS
jgi:hypothetical protein